MCLVPHHSACEADLLPRLQQLPRFNNNAAIVACTLTSPGDVTCWTGAPGEGLAARESPQQAAI
jgi:hypothetical protein